MEPALLRQPHRQGDHHAAGRRTAARHLKRLPSHHHGEQRRTVSARGAVGQRLRHKDRQRLRPRDHQRLRLRDSQRPREGHLPVGHRHSSASNLVRPRERPAAVHRPAVAERGQQAAFVLARHGQEADSAVGGVQAIARQDSVQGNGVPHSSRRNPPGPSLFRRRSS